MKIAYKRREPDKALESSFCFEYFINRSYYIDMDRKYVIPKLQKVCSCKIDTNRALCVTP